MAVELGTGFVALTVEAKGIDNDLRRSVGEPAEREADRAGRTAGDKFSAGFGGSLKNLAVVAGGALAAVGIGQFIGGAVSAGSDLNEVMSKSATVFGENAAWVDQWGSSAAKNFGQSKAEAVGAAAQFGNMFKQLGIGADTTVETSATMTELASDFASFHNADITEVLDAQTAAFRGEYDSIQKFLPLLNATAVEQKALAMTGKTTTDALTDQDKALATAQLMMEGAGDAMGDFARTSEGAANQQRILKARFADIQAEIGQRLLPIITGIAGFILDKVLPAFQAFGTEAAGGIRALVAAFKAGDGDITSSGFPGFMERVGFIARQVVDFFVANWPTIRDVMITVFNAVKTAVMTVVDVLRSLITFIATNQPVLIGVAAAIATVLVAAFVSWAVTAGSAAIATLLAMAPLIALAAAVAIVVAGFIWAYQNVEVFRNIIDAVASFITGTLWPVLQQLGQIIGQVIVAYIQIAIAAIRTYIEIWMAVIQAVIQVVSWVVTKVGEMVGVITAIPGQVSSFLSSVFDALKQAASDAYNWVRDAAGSIIDAIKNIPRSVAGVFGGMFDGIANAFRSAVNVVIDGWNRLSFTVGGGSFLGVNIPSFTLDTPNIGRLAKGGIVYGESTVVVGEYAGARHNPEVIAPLDKLQRMLEPAGRSEGGLHLTQHNYTNADPTRIARAFDFQQRVAGI